VLFGYDNQRVRFAFKGASSPPASATPLPLPFAPSPPHPPGSPRARTVSDLVAP
jgi:hypothetical protein